MIHSDRLLVVPVLDTRTAERIRAQKTAQCARVLLVAKYSCGPEALTEAAMSYIADQVST